MKELFKNNFTYIFLITLITCFIVFFFTFISDLYVGGDGMSIYYPVINLLKNNSLNFWNPLNTTYQTYYFMLGFSDVAIKSFGEIYPMQPSSIILFYSFFMSFLGNESFFYFNFVGAIFIVLFSFLILRELYPKDKNLQYIGVILIMFTPLLIFRVLIPQNIIPATLFLFTSIYYLVKYDKTNKFKYWCISLLFLFFSILIRTIFFLFILGYVVYLFKGSKNNVIKKIIFGLFIFIITLLFFPLTNYMYFGDWSFLGYMNTDYHPNPIGYENTKEYSTDKGISSINTDVYGIISGIIYFIKGSIYYILPIIFLSFIGLLGKFNNNRFFIFSIIIIFINLIYFSNVRGLLWGDDFNLAGSFFRYLLPINLLIVLFIPNALKKISKFNLIIFISLYIMIFGFYTYKYSGGGNLHYIKEVDGKIDDYIKQLNGIIPKGSVILYADRTPQQYFSPNIFDYNWFCYINVPLEIRNIHTDEIVNKLLTYNNNVYFASFDEPYNLLTKDMEEFLRGKYGFEFVEGTEFERQKFKFYKLTKNNNEKVSSY